MNLSLLSISILIPLHTYSWSLNPLNWGKTDKSQENLQTAIETVAKQYRSLMEITLAQLAKASENPKPEEEAQIMENLQRELIVYIKKVQTVPEFLQKKMQQNAKSMFPYLTYLNDLNADLKILQQAIETYIKNTPEKKQNEQLIQLASQWFLILQAVLESLSKSPEVQEETKIVDTFLKTQDDASTQTDVSTSTNNN